MKIFYSIIISILFLTTYYSQSSEKKIIFDSKTNLRSIAQNEFGDADLWPYILIYNNLDPNSSPKDGTTLFLPSKKIKDVIIKFITAETAINNAVDIGAKVLSEDLINTAINKYDNAKKLKREFNFDKLNQICEEVIYEANEAYKRTKEIREKTVDAILSYKIGTVQKLLPSSIKWNNINILENLKENDWARTLTMSLAKITFYDLNQIKLNENSQAIIQHSKFDQLTNKATTNVKIEKGDAYAMLINSPKKKFDLDIKGVKTKINSKYFWVEKTKNAAKFSNYNGTIEIMSNDSIVSIKRNEGTIITENNPPLKPISLLPPPTLIFPSDKSLIENSTINFSWTKVENAKNYWFELAEDDSYKTVLLQNKNITTNNQVIENIQDGIKYWRVCSVDKHGLPGIYSEPKAIIIKTNKLLPQIIIFEPTNFYSTKEKQILIKGKTEPNCNLTINDNKVDLENNLFTYKINLIEGLNKIKIASTNSSNKTNTLFLNIYYEANPNIELYENDKFIDKELIKKVNQNKFELTLRTRPFASIKLFDDNKNILHSTTADSNGNFTLPFNLKEKVDNKFLSIISRAGYQRELNVKLFFDNTSPRIIFENEIPLFTNQNILEIKGKVFDYVDFKINNEKISTDVNGNFFFNLPLKEKNNKIIFEATDDIGNTIKLTKNIYFDIQPPIYLEYKFSLKDAKSNLYELIVFAKDESKLLKTANAQIFNGSKLINEILLYDEKSKSYSTSFISTSSNPKLISITLKDEVGNEKKYIVNK